MTFQIYSDKMSFSIYFDKVSPFYFNLTFYQLLYGFFTLSSIMSPKTLWPKCVRWVIWRKCVWFLIFGTLLNRTMLTLEAYWKQFVCSTRSNSVNAEIFAVQRNSEWTNQRALWLICNPTPPRQRKTKKSNGQKVSRAGRCSRVDKTCRQK